MMTSLNPEPNATQYCVRVLANEQTATPISPLLYSNFIELGYGIQVEPMQGEMFFNRAEADALLKRVVQKYAATAPRLSAWMEQSLPEGLTVFALPEAHRRLLRTTNGVERVNREVRRRTRVASIFPNEAACLRLVSALLMEISDDWQVCKAYRTFTDTEPSKDAPTLYRNNLTLSRGPY